MAFLEVRLREVVVGHPRVGILADRVGPEDLGVFVDADLRPRRHPERDQPGGADGRGHPRFGREDAFEPPLSRHGDQRQRPDAGEILEVVGDEREPHRIDVDESEGGEQRADEEEHRDERPLAHPGPHADRRRSQDDDHRDRIQPLLRSLGSIVQRG